MNDEFISNSMATESMEELTLMRNLDLNYTPNKILLMLMPIILLGSFGWYFYMNNMFVQSVFFALIQSIIVFLCWAVGRELDPDHDYAAFFGLPLLFLPDTFTQGNIFVLFWFLISLRLLNQTTGKIITSSDVTFYVFLSILSVLLSNQIIILPLALLIIVLTSFLPNKHRVITT